VPFRRIEQAISPRVPTAEARVGIADMLRAVRRCPGHPTNTAHVANFCNAAGR
jgi:hypothetical protein